ncbi:MAG: TIGR03757 family integrating conjugative element protein [Cellvibrionaceae bacterium]|nr:TIGR03757 family integrating conjugative element protein [Cellvibrionaceae bacterium]
MAFTVLKSLAAGFFLITASTALSQPAIHLEIFSDDDLALPTIPGVSIVAHNMNAIAREQEKISRRFTGKTVEEAQKKAEAWVRSPAYQEYAVHRERIFLPLRRAAQFQIAKIPAVLINEQFIVYGTSDPRTALDDYHRYLLARSAP